MVPTLPVLCFWLAWPCSASSLAMRSICLGHSGLLNIPGGTAQSPHATQESATWSPSLPHPQYRNECREDGCSTIGFRAPAKYWAPPGKRGPSQSGARGPGDVAPRGASNSGAGTVAGAGSPEGPSGSNISTITEQRTAEGRTGRAGAQGPPRGGDFTQTMAATEEISPPHCQPWQVLE